MLPENIQWFFPEKIEEALSLINKPGHLLHAGGTRILRIKSRNIRGLVDISKLKLDYIKKVGSTYHIGSATHFAKIIELWQSTGALELLGKSLSTAASTPLRNRITVGGSLKDFPLWSNLYAPLLALDAKIKILGEESGIFSIEEYLEKQIIKTKHIIHEIIIDDKSNLLNDAFRFALLRFEYPIFNLAATVKVENGIVKSSRIFITGVKSKHKRAVKVEEDLLNKPFSKENIEHAVHKFAPKFVADYKYSAEYKEDMAKVHLTDLLNNIRERARL